MKLNDTNKIYVYAVILSRVTMPMLSGVISAVVFTGACFCAASAKAEVFDKIIFNHCASAMRGEYEKAQIELGISVLNQTCSCVVEHLKRSYNICIFLNFCPPE